MPVLAATCCLAFAAGCGGDEGAAVTGDAEPPTPSKRDYVVQADTICGQSEQGLQAEAEIAFGIDARDFTVAPSGEIAFKPGRRPSDARVQAFGTEVVIPRLREQVDDLRSLTPPRGDELTVAQIYDTAEQGIDRLAADPSRFTDEGAARRALNQARRLARGYGFFDCGTYSGP
ncbi:MAG: hypothetical protein M3O25_07100 [Actinomycetota bacterium]|nr:hypothetical protein [Actinomycetota bacterium]